MQINRRKLLAGSAVLAAYSSLPRDAKGWLHPGSPNGAALHGWNTLPLGAGGLVTGFDIALDNSIVCRTDVGNLYVWSGTTGTTTNPSDKWNPLFTLSSLAGISSNPKQNWSAWGGLEVVQAPSDATKIWALFVSVDNTANSNVYYSTNRGVTWALSNLVVANSSPASPPYSKRAYHRIAVDPNNVKIVYVGMVTSSGNSSGVYTTLVKAGGSDGHTFGPVYLDSSDTIPVGQTTSGTGANGLCFDPHPGTTTTPGGETVTKHIYMPVGGVDIYETYDGGVNWTSTGAAIEFGGAAFSLNCAVVNSNGVYYCAVNGNAIYRYIPNGTAGGGAWYKFTAIYTGGNASAAFLIIDPNDPTYLSVTGPSGSAFGYTSTNADTGTPPTFTSTAVGSGNLSLTAPSYDCGYLNYIFQQGSGAGFTYGADVCCLKIDGNGDTIIAGNQSIWKMSGRIMYNGSAQTYVSFGRGQEATVAQEAWRPSNGTYALIGAQDLGGVNYQGTYTSYPTNVFQHQHEWVCSSIDESPTDGSFVAARITSQGGFTDGSGFSTDAGATWSAFPTTPSGAYLTAVVGGTGGVSSSTLTISSVVSGPKPFIGQQLSINNNYYIIALGTVNPDGTGTYTLNGSITISNGTSFNLQPDTSAGQILALDNNHQIILPCGFSHGAPPVYTTDQGNTWAMSAGIPSWNYWVTNAWYGAPTNKPMAGGFGTDVGKVWVVQNPAAGDIVTVYRSTDYGANFSATANNISITTAYLTSMTLVAVPGYPGELWCLPSQSAGSPKLWHSTDSGDTWTAVTPPDAIPTTLCIGAIDPVSGTYPTIWCTARPNVSTDFVSLYYSINMGVSWIALSSTGASGARPDLPAVNQLWGISGVRADRQIFKRLYIACGQTGFAYYNP